LNFKNNDLTGDKSNPAKNFDILAACLSILHYFDNSTKLLL